MHLFNQNNLNRKRRGVLLSFLSLPIPFPALFFFLYTEISAQLETIAKEIIDKKIGKDEGKKDQNLCLTFSIEHKQEEEEEVRKVSKYG